MFRGDDLEKSEGQRRGPLFPVLPAVGADRQVPSQAAGALWFSTAEGALLVSGHRSPLIV